MSPILLPWSSLILLGLQANSCGSSRKVTPRRNFSSCAWDACVVLGGRGGPTQARRQIGVGLVGSFENSARNRQAGSLTYAPARGRDALSRSERRLSVTYGWAWGPGRAFAERKECPLGKDEFFFLLATGSRFLQTILVEAGYVRGCRVFIPGPRRVEGLSETVFIPSIEPQLIDNRFLRSESRRTVPVIFADKREKANIQNELDPRGEGEGRNTTQDHHWARLRPADLHQCTDARKTPESLPFTATIGCVLLFIIGGEPRSACRIDRGGSDLTWAFSGDCNTRGSERPKTAITRFVSCSLHILVFVPVLATTSRDRRTERAPGPLGRLRHLPDGLRLRRVCPSPRGRAPGGATANGFPVGERRVRKAIQCYRRRTIDLAVGQMTEILTPAVGALPGDGSALQLRPGRGEIVRLKPDLLVGASYAPAARRSSVVAFRSARCEQSRAAKLCPSARRRGAIVRLKPDLLLGEIVRLKPDLLLGEIVRLKPDLLLGRLSG